MMDIWTYSTSLGRKRGILKGHCQFKHIEQSYVIDYNSLIPGL